MKAKMNVQFNPKETPLSEIERKLKFIEKLPIDNCQMRKVRLSEKREEFKGNFNVIFKEENTVDIIPVGNVNITYFDLEELSNFKDLKEGYFGCDNNCLTIYDESVNKSTDSYCFFYKGK